MATFDADAYRAAREPFTVIVHGRTYVARPVSAELVIDTQPALASGDRKASSAALKRLLRAAFPWKLRMWWQGDPVFHILYLDPATRNALVTRFFFFLGGADEPPPATPGTP